MCAALCPVTSEFRGFSIYNPPGPCICLYDDGLLPAGGTAGFPSKLDSSWDGNTGTGPINKTDGFSTATCYKYIGPYPSASPSASPSKSPSLSPSGSPTAGPSTALSLFVNFGVGECLDTSGSSYDYWT